MSEFKVIETQEQFDSMIQDRLTRKENSVRAEYADYEQLKEKCTSYESQITALNAQIAESSGKDDMIKGLNDKIAAYEIDSAKTKAAMEFGIPLEFADRISGTDADSIRADAEKFAPMFKKHAPAATSEPTITSTTDSALLRMSRSLVSR